MASKTLSSRLTAVSNLVKDSLSYAFQQLIRGVLEGILGGALKNPEYVTQLKDLLHTQLQQQSYVAM